MKKIILSVITVFSLICPSLIIVLNQSVHACPVKAPETLLSLYKESETIHRARFTSREEGEAKPENEEYSVAEISRNFDVLATHKGKSAEKVTIFEKRYIYKPNPAVSQEVEIAESEDQEAPPDTEETEGNAGEEESTAVVSDEEMEDEGMVELKPGDEVLLFLRTGEESGGVELTDYRDGLKQLPRQDIAIYETRIKELNTILAPEKPNPEKIVDWLIRCAEEPATRWEGTYELERSFNALEYKLAREAEEKENPGKAGGVRYLGGGREFTHEYAEAMNEYHRQTLTDLLVNADLANQQPNKKKASVPGDQELMDLVSRWADRRIAQVLVERLRSGGSQAAENSPLMVSIAAILKDKKLDALADEFQDIAYQDDNETVEPSDANSETENTSTEKEPDVKTTDPVIEPGKTEERAVTSEAPAEVPKKAKKVEITYGQLRRDIVERFLARADKLILEPEAAAETKTPIN